MLNRAFLALLHYSKTKNKNVDVFRHIVVYSVYQLCFNTNCAFVVRAFNIKQKPYVLNTSDIKFAVPVTNKPELTHISN